MAHFPGVQWQPLSNLPLLAGMVEEMYGRTEEQHQDFLEARETPSALDDATVRRARKVYEEQLHFLAIYEEQFKRWQRERPSTQQRQLIEALASKVAQGKAWTQEILAMLEEIKDHTIDKVMAKSDLELGLDAVINMTKKRRR